MESLQIKDYMNSYPVTFSADMVVEQASLRFLKTKQIGGPVIDKQNNLVGFLSENDVLSTMLQSIYFNEQHLQVEDIMQKAVISVKPYDSVVELGQTMLKNNPKVYPVVNDDGVLVGCICRNDVLKAIHSHMQAGFNIKRVDS